MDTTTFIFANGILRNSEWGKRLIQPGDLLIAADGGGMHLKSMGLTPHYIIGDLDSIYPDVLDIFNREGCRILRYPVDKDETDLELAIQLALKMDNRKIIIIAGLGGRLDQTLGNLSLLTDESLGEADISLEDGVEEAWFFTDRTEIHGAIGDTVSLIPWGGTAAGVTTDGLKYPLSNESLFPEHTRGISNQLMLNDATVTVSSGKLLCVHTRKP